LVFPRSKGLPAGVRLAFSPDGKSIVSFGGMRQGSWQTGSLVVTAHGPPVKLWVGATGEELLTFKNSEEVNGAAFSSDGRHLASWSIDNTVHVWDVATGAKQLTIPGRDVVYRKNISDRFSFSGVNNLGFSPDGTRLATAAAERTVKVWDAAGGKELLNLQGHTSYAMSAAFSPDGKRLATASSDQTVKLWDTTSGQEVLTLKLPGQVNKVMFSPDGKRLASVLRDGTITIWDASRSMRELDHRLLDNIP
jgi:WD40 repeat protein